MSPTTKTTLALAACAAGLALGLEETRSTGVLVGFLCGALAAGAVLLFQKKVARARPEYVTHAVLGGFLAKACLLAGLTLAVRFVPALQERCDAVSFLIAFALTALAILLPATIEVIRLVERGFPSRGGPKNQPAR